MTSTWKRNLILRCIPKSATLSLSRDATSRGLVNSSNSKAAAHSARSAASASKHINCQTYITKSIRSIREEASYVMAYQSISYDSCWFDVFGRVCSVSLSVFLVVFVFTRCFFAVTMLFLNSHRCPLDQRRKCDTYVLFLTRKHMIMYTRVIAMCVCCPNTLTTQS